MNKVTAFLRKETVLCVSLMLAAVSAFFVPPDRGYLDYIDFRTLAVLFCLMSVMAGLQKIGIFRWIAQMLLGRVKSGRSLVLTLVLLCFFSSMLITNDVALITFVPFTFTVLDLLGEEQKKRLLLPVVVMQTIAANLGSMLTPVGNPQNLYLYGKAGFSVGAFLVLMLPYTALSLVLLSGWGLVQGSICSRDLKLEPSSVQGEPWHKQDGRTAIYLLVIYMILFLLCLLTVGHILPWQAVFLVVFLVILMADKRVLVKVDYSLLFTFAGFFIFIGNVGRIPAFCAFLQDIITGREVYTSIIASQVISNVPAALLLSGFTDDFAALVIGTNLGGLGTLIASMASLISYKYVAKEAGGRKGAYILLFTVGNICFLTALMLLNVWLA
ncbi:MAG: citrate transporter [Lachnospiraceae bacterium]|nr:citrate transporter [Lachnospiraceae bacterium]